MHVFISYTLYNFFCILYTDSSLFRGTADNIFRSGAYGLHSPAAHPDNHRRLSGVNEQARARLQQSSNSAPVKPFEQPSKCRLPIR